MSQKILQEINNRVDNKNSEYYYNNKRKRDFWHSRSITISCRVRDKNEFNKAPEMAINIRAFLLEDDKKFQNEVWSTENKLQEKDMKQLRNYVYSLFPNVSKKELDKKMGLIIMNLPEDEVKGALGLDYVVACRLLGYEKELIFLKSYKIGILPAFLLRSLYHTKYSHSEFETRFDQYAADESLDKNPYFNVDYIENGLNDPYKGLEFSYYLDKIKFL